jgi:N-acyl-D-aspartate/D-glutamate deacylase
MMASGARDLVLRGGTIVDGTGAAPYEGDVTISDGRIADVGPVGVADRFVAGRGVEELDARGLLVTPGFVDVHTHYDGQVTWAERLLPSSGHGVTTALFGNCGVGFAPCRPSDRALLMRVMEGVEDIPEPVLSAGLPWTWESYPDYLELLATRRYDMDVGGLLPHSALRIFVMGERGAAGAPATAADRAAMRELAYEAVRAGALGVGTSRLKGQKGSDGAPIPTLEADERELRSIAKGLRDAGEGILQIAIEFNRFPDALDELAAVIRVAEVTGCTATFSMKQSNSDPEGWRRLLAAADEANAAGIRIRPQVFSRPTGAILGLETSVHPLSRAPTYQPLASLPLAERVEQLRRPAVRRQILDELADPGRRMRSRVGFGLMFPMADPPDYEPRPEDSLAAEAERRGVPPEELAYDLMLADDGRGQLLLAGGNYAQATLDPALEMMRNQHSVLGLGDGGAHCTIVCDASLPTHLLTYWTRERTRGARLPLPDAVRRLTRDGAELLGLQDRGVIAAGYRADVNVIDYQRLALHAPRMVYDLPAGGRRLLQDADGYVATIVDGTVVYRGGEATGELPGRLVRGSQPAPVPADA